MVFVDNDIMRLFEFDVNISGMFETYRGPESIITPRTETVRLTVRAESLRDAEEILGNYDFEEVCDMTNISITVTSTKEYPDDPDFDDISFEYV